MLPVRPGASTATISTLTAAKGGDDMTAKRIDVLSDTHGRLSREVLDQLDGCDLIVHAGDITSEEDFATLGALAPLRLCLGNNDWSGEYGPDVTRMVRFEYEGLHFSVTHYREKLTGDRFDVGVFGHTHVPVCEYQANGSLLMNPGSPTFPRSAAGPTMGRIFVEDGRVTSAKIIKLGDGQEERRGWGHGFFFGW